MAPTAPGALAVAAEFWENRDMALTQEELDSFHHFAGQRLQTANEELTIEELVNQWRIARERNEVNAAIAQGLADIEKGKFRPLERFMAEFRKNRDIPKGA